MLKRCLFFICILFLHTTAYAEVQRIAVLEFRGVGVDAVVLPVITDYVRSGVLEGIGQNQNDDLEMLLMTRENMMDMLSSMGKNAGDCQGECVVELARNMGTDYVISGEITKLGDLFVLNIKLHETARGQLLVVEDVRGSKLDEMLDQAKSAGTLVVQKGLLVSQDEIESLLGRVDIKSIPDGIDIYSSTEKWGTTPFKKEVKSGTYTLEIKDPCFEPIVHSLEIKSSEKEKVLLSLKKKQSEILVLSDMDKDTIDGRVFVDGNEVGNTEEVISVPVCSKKIEVRISDGQSWVDDLSLQENQRATIKAKIVPNRSNKEEIDSESKSSAKGFSYHNPAASVYLYVPSSIPMKKGERYISQKSFLFTSGAVAITDNVTVLGGGVTPNPFSLSVVGGKYSYEYSPTLRFSVGGQAFFSAWRTFESRANVAYVGVTYGDEDTNISLNVGAGDVMGELGFPINLSASHRFTDRYAIVTENWLLIQNIAQMSWDGQVVSKVDSELYLNAAIVSLAIRNMGVKTRWFSRPNYEITTPNGRSKKINPAASLDYGLVCLVNDGLSSPIGPIPWIDWGRKF